MKKKNGFTLAELLVVVVILGIITGISIPLIRSLTEKNRQREYTTYLETLKQSAKLYVNSYEEDLFGHENSGCAIIRYSQLEEKKLIKDIAVRDVSCDSEDTYVKVVKLDGKTSYASTIRCGSRNADGGINVETQLSDKEMGDINNCGLDNKTIISFSATDPSDSINYQRRNLVVNMNSHTGFHENLLIEYGFLKKENKPAEGENPTSYLIDGWKKLDVNYIGGNEQKRKIEDGESITLSSNKIITPKNQTEDLYLVLKIHSLKDLGGRNWTTEIGRGNYVYFGTYRVDNSNPTFSEDSTIVSNNSSYNSKDPKLKINVTDNRYSTSNDLRMCISYDSDTCSKKVKDIKNNNGYEKYDSTKVLLEIKDDLDGSNHTIYVTVGDAAGNYTTVSYPYTLAITLTYDPNGGTGTMNPTYCNINTACRLAINQFTRSTDYEYLGWYNASKDGTKYEDTATFTSSSTIYAQWKLLYIISFHYTGSFKVTKDGTVYTDADYQTLEKDYKIWFLTSGTLTTYVDSNIDVFLVGGGQRGSTDYGGRGGGVAYTTSTIQNGGSYEIAIGESGQDTVAFGQTAYTGQGAGGSHRVHIYSGAQCGAGNYSVYRGYGWGGVGPYAWNDPNIDGVRYGCGGTGGGSCCGMTCCGTTCNGAGGAFPTGCGGGNNAWGYANGLPNTGGGGGGASWWGNGGHSGGSGGSGVVIIRKKEG